MPLLGSWESKEVEEEVLESCDPMDSDCSCAIAESKKASTSASSLLSAMLCAHVWMLMGC